MHIYSRFLLRVLELHRDAKLSAYPNKSTYHRQDKERVQWWTQVAVRYQCSPPRLSVEALSDTCSKLKEELPAILPFSRANN